MTVPPSTVACTRIGVDRVAQDVPHEDHRLADADDAGRVDERRLSQRLGHARASRAYHGHQEIASAIAACSRLGPSSAAITIASRSGGNDRKRSVIRISSSSSTAAAVAGDQPERHADQHGDARPTTSATTSAGRAPKMHAAEDVAAEMVGAEEVRPARRELARRDIASRRAPAPGTARAAARSAPTKTRSTMIDAPRPSGPPRVTPERAARMRRGAVRRREARARGESTADAHSSLHPRVEPRLDDVDDEVDRQERDRAEERDPHDHRVVDVEQRVGRELADPGPVEDELDEERPGEQVREREPGHGQRRRQRVAQREPPEDRAARRARTSGRCGCSPGRARRASTRASSARSSPAGRRRA